MGIEHNLQIVAKGCFLAGTLISTPDGEKPIETLRAGDEVISFNEKTGEQEISVIGDIDILQRDHYYNINNQIKATGEHPFYTNKGIVEVQNFDSTHRLIDDNGNEVLIGDYIRVEESVTVYNLLDVAPNNNYFANHFLVHNKGCFLAGTFIETPDGKKKIETLNIGDRIYSFNEKTGVKEPATIERIDVLESTAHFVINGKVKATSEHPFYTWVNGKLAITKVGQLKNGDQLVTKDGKYMTVESLTYVQQDETVYNLINVTPNNNYFANDFLVHNKGGGGCFLAGTQINTKEGVINIENIQAGDKVMSYNETTGRKNTSIVERLDILDSDGFYIINDSVNVTGEHPFYTIDGIKLVKDLKVGDTLKTDDDDELIVSIKYIEAQVKIYNLINVAPNHNYYANGYLVHNKGGFSGGGRSSGGIKGGSSSKSSGSKTSSAPAKPKAGTSTAKPGSKIKTADGKEVQSSTKAPSNKKYTSSTGVVGDNGYTPRFTNGYSPPPGSVVYRENNSALDYLPWIYLFSQNSPRNDQVTTVQPDGKEVVAQPVQEGVDGLAVFNWILMFVIIIAVVGGIIYGVNKLTSKPKPRSSGYHGYY